MRKLKNFEDMRARVTDARRKLDLTQVELAKKVGISQSALSMFEHGSRDALSVLNIEKILDVLGIRIEDAGALDESEVPLSHGHCVNPICLGAQAKRVGGLPFIIPRRIVSRSATRQPKCELCGSVIRYQCQCGSDVSLGLNCPTCGTAYLPDWPDQFKPCAGNPAALDAEVQAFNTERSSLLSLLGVPEVETAPNQPAATTDPSFSVIPGGRNQAVAAG